MSNVIIALWAASGFDRAAQGVAGAGRRLAEQLGAKLHAIVVGARNEELNAALASATDAVVAVEQTELHDYQPEAYLAALTEIAKQIGPAAVLLGNDAYSQELAPRLAHRLGGSAAGDATALTVADGRVRVTRSVYGGKAEATIALKRAPAIVWLRARAFDPAAPASNNTTVTTAMVNVPRDTPTRIIERKAESTNEARLEDARVIVSGGRGLGGPEAFADLQELAAQLGGMTAASRAACDAGWCPPSWQVGQTGKKVAPGLYLAVAIRGASQHLAGMSDSKVIAAINNDADAPIFKHCSFGIVEDCKKVLPLLKEKLAALNK